MGSSRPLLRMDSRHTGRSPGCPRYLLVRDHHARRHDGFCSLGASMEMITVTLISVGLAMDALAVSLGIGTAGQIATVRGKIRLASHFGIFQSGMTALGWLAGQTIVRYVDGFDHW